MTDIFIKISDFICGYPLFIVLVGGGLFLFIYSGAIPFRSFGAAIQALRHKPDGEGQISSFQALMTTISSTVGMGNIAGVAIAICMGGPGAIFWMWVSAVFGMATKFFEGTLATMYKGKDSRGEVQGGLMYIVQSALSKRWMPVAVIFSVAGLLECLCLMQSNQLTEIATAIFIAPENNTMTVHFIIGLSVTFIVSLVVVGGLQRMAKFATRIVPFMIILYFLMVFYIIITNLGAMPEIFKSIIVEAFSPRAVAGGGIAAMVFVAITGFRRAMMINEAGLGTATMMHGSSKQSEPVREGLAAMICPSIDSGLICTLTAIAILVQKDFIQMGGGLNSMEGLRLCVASFDASIPYVGKYLLLVVIFCFSFSTMFSYSYYGQKCTGFLFGAKYSKYYLIPYLLMLVIAAVIPLRTVVSLVDMAGAIMVFCTIPVLVKLAPQVKKRMKQYLHNERN